MIQGKKAGQGESFEASSPPIRKAVPGLPAAEGSDETTQDKVLEKSEVPGLKICQTFIITTAGGGGVTSYLLSPLLVRIGGGCSQDDQRGRVEAKGTSPLHLRAFSLSRSRVVSAQTGIPTQKAPAEPLGGRRPAETQADSLSARALCWPRGAGAASGLYIKAAWRARPGECRSGAGAQGERGAA